MRGWIVPPPKEPIKVREDFDKERNKKVTQLIKQGYLKSELIKEAMKLSVYACILAPFKEWEVLTMIRNIFAKKKPRGQDKSHKDQISKYPG